MCGNNILNIKVINSKMKFCIEENALTKVTGPRDKASIPANAPNKIKSSLIEIKKIALKPCLLIINFRSLYE